MSKKSKPELIVVDGNKEDLYQDFFDNFIMGLAHNDQNAVKRGFEIDKRLAKKADLHTVGHDGKANK